MRWLLSCSLLLLPFCAFAKHEGFNHDRYITGYAGFATSNTYSEVLLVDNVSYTDGHSLGVGYGQRLTELPGSFTLEAEGTLHLHQQAGETFPEVNAALLARWQHPPWSRWLDSTVAVGQGLSVASQTPPLEKNLHRNDETHPVLNLLIFEADIKLRETPRNSLHGVLRLHHRSGVFGLFNGVDSGSNLVMFGLRQRF